MRFLSACICAVTLTLITLGGVNAQTSIDLEAVMKKMGHSYKLAVKAQSSEQMLAALTEFEGYVQQAQQARFNNEAEKSLKGLEEVLLQLESARQLAATEQLDAAREQLMKIDDLRKEYHELHEPPGFWELLFGK